jgi:hypothetical protein
MKSQFHNWLRLPDKEDYWYLTTLKTDKGYIGIEWDIEWDYFGISKTLIKADEEYIFKNPPIKNLTYNMIKFIFEGKLDLEKILKRKK